MFCLGNRGSGKSTLGVWLAKQLGIFHLKFREQLQMIIVTKTGQRVPYSDEVETKEDLTTQIKKARQAGADKEEEDEEKEESDSQEVSAFLHPCVVFTIGFLLVLFLVVHWCLSLLSKGQGRPELELTEDEQAIKAYLSNGESLNAKILDTIVKPLWQQEPYRYLNRV